MKSGKAFFIISWLVILLIALSGCPADDPDLGFNLEMMIPPEPQIMGSNGSAANGHVTVQKPGYEKYWAIGGYVEVEMTVADGYITEVIIDLFQQDLTMCKEINERWGRNDDYGPGWMVERNSVDLDVVSGATYTSIDVLEAAAEALEHIKNGTQPQPTVSLDKEFIILAAGTSATLNAKVSLIDVDSLVWSSSDDDIAVVNREGKVTARNKNGFTVIKAEYADTESSFIVFAECVVIVYGAAVPDADGMIRVKRVTLSILYDERGDGSFGNENQRNTWLYDDGGYLAIGKNMTLSTSVDDPPLWSWWVMEKADDSTKMALKNVHSGKYLNVKGITRGTDNTTLPASQPRVSPFEDDPGFYWEFYDTGDGYNILSRGTARNSSDATNPDVGALSNKGYPCDDTTIYGYPKSQTGNLFLSEPCNVDFPFKHVQWRFDATNWTNTLNTDEAYLFDIFDE